MKGRKKMSKKVHCILCDRKYTNLSTMMKYIRLPRNKITVPVCVHCIERYKLCSREMICLTDVIGPVVTEAINEGIKIQDIYGSVIDDILKTLRKEGP